MRSLPTPLPQSGYADPFGDSDKTDQDFIQVELIYLDIFIIIIFLFRNMIKIFPNSRKSSTSAMMPDLS